MRASTCSSSSAASSSRMLRRVGFARATSRPVASNGSCPSTSSSLRSRCWPSSSIRRGTGSGTWNRATSCVRCWYFRCPRRRTSVWAGHSSTNSSSIASPASCSPPGRSHTFRRCSAAASASGSHCTCSGWSTAFASGTFICSRSITSSSWWAFSSTAGVISWPCSGERLRSSSVHWRLPQLQSGSAHASRRGTCRFRPWGGRGSCACSDTARLRGCYSWEPSTRSRACAGFREALRPGCGWGRPLSCSTCRISSCTRSSRRRSHCSCRQRRLRAGHPPGCRAAVPCVGSPATFSPIPENRLDALVIDRPGGACLICRLVGESEAVH